MAQNQDTRWKQRFSNFEKVLQHLEDAVTRKDLSMLEKAGVIQMYEIGFELAWKTLKDYLEEKSVIVKFPRDTIKEAFAYEIIKNGDVWMEMLQNRNLMSHTYDEEKAELAYGYIVNHYFFELRNVYHTLKKEI